MAAFISRSQLKNTQNFTSTASSPERTQPTSNLTLLSSINSKKTIFITTSLTKDSPYHLILAAKN